MRILRLLTTTTAFTLKPAMWFLPLLPAPARFIRRLWMGRLPLLLSICLLVDTEKQVVVLRTRRNIMMS
jgi:hypothetical protein